MLEKRCKCDREAWSRCAHSWWYRFTAGAREYARSTRTTKVRDAERVELARRAEVDRDRGTGRRAAGGHTLADVYRLDLERRRKRVKRRGHGDTREVEQHWTAIFKVVDEATDIRLVTGKLAVAFDEHTRSRTSNLGEPVRGTTIRRYLKTLWRGLELGHSKGWLPRLPVDWPEIEADDEPSKAMAGRLHSPEVVGAWLEHLTQDARDEAELVTRTSLRGEQAKRWLHEWNAMRTEGDHIAQIPALASFPKGAAKNKRKGMLVPLTARAWEIVERRRATFPDNPHVLAQASHRSTYRSAIVRALDAEVERLVATGMPAEEAETDARRRGYGERIKRRDLRHYFATIAEKKSQDRKAVADILGHTTLRTTERYLHSDEARVVAAMAAADTAIAGTLTRDTEGKMYGAESGTRNRDLLITNQPSPPDHDALPRKDATGLALRRMVPRRFSFVTRDVRRDIRAVRFEWGRR